MLSRHKKLILLSIGALVILILSTLLFVSFSKKPAEEVLSPTENQNIEELETVATTSNIEILGASVEGRKIEAFTFGKGDTHLVFVGGIHGGYEWNSVLLSYTLIDFLEANPNLIPSTIRVTVIPSVNPDGLFKVLGKEGRFTASDVPAKVAPEGLGRFNTNNVDLNRNFDCKWKPESTWRGKEVSAGTVAFSEPEATALKNFMTTQTPDAVVFFHSQSNAVYASECENGILPATKTLMNTYAKASGYPAVETFDAYEVTGDAEGWLASIQIPAITVELKTHETIEWERNLAGVKALFASYGSQTGM